MHWIDVTVPIRPGMPRYPGDPDVALVSEASIAAGDEFNLTRLAMGTHTGTHVDAPAHFITGAPTVEALELDVLIGPACVVDATPAGRQLDAAALAALDVPNTTARLVLKTSNSRLWGLPAFDPDYAALTEDGARWLIERGIRLIAIDYLSVAPAGDAGPVHRALLAAGVVIVEGIDLRGVAAGDYTLVCLPLLIAGADGAPARVLLGRDAAPDSAR